MIGKVCRKFSFVLDVCVFCFSEIRLHLFSCSASSDDIPQLALAGPDVATPLQPVSTPGTKRAHARTPKTHRSSVKKP